MRLLIFLSAVLILGWASSSPAFYIMYSAYKLNKQGDNIKPWRAPFPILNQSVVPCLVLQISQGADKVVRYSHLFKNVSQFVVIHTVKSFSVINKAEVDVFLELSCFFDYLTDVDSLISDSSPFLKPAWASGSSQFMYCWSLAWRILSISLLVCEMSASVQ